MRESRIAYSDEVSAPRIHESDETWSAIAREILSELRPAVDSLPTGQDATLEHIGSTAVPGLAAKPIIDLQVRFSVLPTEEDAQRVLTPFGFVRSRGSRPDSPGVDFDVPRPGTDQDSARHAKLLFHRAATSVAMEAILHLRRADSPFAAFVVAFRDWLRADDVAAARYESLKREIAERYADAADYDDYTRAKTAVIDRMQQSMGWPASVEDVPVLLMKTEPLAMPARDR